MKKLLIVAVVMALGAGFAYAGSLSIPWFVDDTNINSYDPPNAQGQYKTMVFLHNNTAATKTCWIRYYTNVGALVPFAGGATEATFTIPANATIAFRPAADDPGPAAGGGPGGSEAPAGRAVPNRPSTVAGGIYNGSAVVRWAGGAVTDVQGMLTLSNRPPSTSGNQGFVIWGSALPTGVN